MTRASLLKSSIFSLSASDASSAVSKSSGFTLILFLLTLIKLSTIFLEESVMFSISPFAVMSCLVFCCRTSTLSFNNEFSSYSVNTRFVSISWSLSAWTVSLILSAVTKPLFGLCSLFFMFSYFCFSIAKSAYLSAKAVYDSTCLSMFSDIFVATSFSFSTDSFLTHSASSLIAWVDLRWASPFSST